MYQANFVCVEGLLTDQEVLIRLSQEGTNTYMNVSPGSSDAKLQKKAVKKCLQPNSNGQARLIDGLPIFPNTSMCYQIAI